MKQIYNLKISFHTLLVSLTVGLLTGLFGGLFHRATEWATLYRIGHLYIIYLLPFAGLFIVFIYNKTNLNNHPGTNCILSGVRGEKRIPWTIAPNIFISTVITHLFGGSSGREGAALQLGGAIGSQISDVFKTDKKIKPLIIMAGMSGAFSALFGTPLTAVIFAIEVCSVGTMFYSALLPCLICSYIAQFISSLLGNHPVRFIIADAPLTDFKAISAAIIIGILCAMLGSVFCKTSELTQRLAKRINNKYLRIFIGGTLIVILTNLLGSYDYNGAGMDIIEQAISGEAKPYSFILKIIFTAITLGVGFKGGEIIPTFFIGSTFGCIIGPLLGLSPSFSSAIGICALFASVVNCPVAALILACELFGNSGILLYAAAIFVSFSCSGYTSLYKEQLFTFSKNTFETLNRKPK